VADAHEVVEDRLARELLDDAVARATAREPGRDHRRVEALERARDVDPLAAGGGQARARPVPVAELEVRHGSRPVGGRVQSDSHYHGRIPSSSWTVRVAYHRSFPPAPGRSTFRPARSGRVPRRVRPDQISIRPRRWPRETGRLTAVGAT